jgi:hypothetical protein
MHKAIASWRFWGMVIPILFWVCSFFLPAITFPPDNASHWAPAQGMQRGYDAALLSLAESVMSIILLRGALQRGFSWAAVFFYVDSFLWLANLWMFLAPFRTRSLSQGRSIPLLVTIWFWAAAPLPLVWQSFQRGPDGFRPFTLHIGFFLWWLSLLVMASVCTAFCSSASVHSQLTSNPLPLGKSN